MTNLPALTLAALTATGRIEIAAAAAILIWVILAFTVASYGDSRGFSFWPLFLCALALGWPLVLLGIVLANGPTRRGRP